MFKSGLDPTTVNHGINCMVLTVNYYQLYREDLESNRLEDVALGSLLHDIGKIELLTLVRSEKKFTAKEKEKIHAHPIVGYRIAKEMGIENRTVLSAIYNHHRRIDGSGYPNINDDLLPTNFDFLLGFIDSFEAMTSERRQYKGVYGHSHALDILRRDANENIFSKEIYNKFVFSLTPKLYYTPVLEFKPFVSC